MNFFKPAALIVAIIFICSCKSNDTLKEKEQISIAELRNDKIQEGQNFYSDSTGTPGDRESQKKQQQSPEQEVKKDWDKKIIKTASLNIEVKDYNNYYSSLREKIRNVGGYVAQEDQIQSDYKIENTMQVKVPVDQFDNAIALLTTGIEKITEKKISSQDVTTEVVDTKSRMEAKKQVRQRYIDLLKQARNMEEILSVQAEINGVQEQIESGLGRIEYLNHSSTFSTINLTYYQVLNASAKDNSEPSFGTKITNAFKMGWNFISDMFIGLISIWPLYFLIFLAVIIYKRTRTKKPSQA